MLEKQIHPWLRNVFRLGAFLSLVAGIQLFVLARHTDIYFAWTIQSFLASATLGGFYFGSMTFGYLSSREMTWSHVRGPAYGLFLFLMGTLAATLLHLDKFHFADENLLTRSVTWIWLVIYILLPLVLAVSFFLQAKLKGEDSELRSAFPFWFRLLLLVHGVTSLLLSLTLFLSPGTLIPFWAWTLTPLTARALAAWFISFGAVDLFSVRENDWRRMKVTSISYIVTALLGFLSLARYAGEVKLFGVAGIGYLLYLILMLGLGLFGLWMNNKSLKI